MRDLRVKCEAVEREHLLLSMDPGPQPEIHFQKDKTSVGSVVLTKVKAERMIAWLTSAVATLDGEEPHDSEDVV